MSEYNNKMVPIGQNLSTFKKKIKHLFSIRELSKTESNTAFGEVMKIVITDFDGYAGFAVTAIIRLEVNDLVGTYNEYKETSIGSLDNDRRASFIQALLAENMPYWIHPGSTDSRNQLMGDGLRAMEHNRITLDDLLRRVEKSK